MCFTPLYNAPKSTKKRRPRYARPALHQVLHGAAPVSPQVKREMIDWWGPVLYEYYAGTEGNEEALRAARLVQGRGVKIKILGDGDLTKKLVVTADSFSKSAVSKIESAGGKANVTAPAAPQS